MGLFRKINEQINEQINEWLEEAARHDALQKKIEALEKKARADRQPHRKMELFEEIQRLKKI